MPKQKRDNEYFMQRLAADRQDLFREVRAGRMSVNKARQLHGGLGGIRKPLNLKNAWDKAGPKERSEFLSWAGLTPSTSLAPPPVVGAPAASVFDASGHMEAWARRRVLDVVGRRFMTAGGLASELGLKRSDQSVITAAQRGTRVRSPAVRTAVEAWLSRNATV